MLVEGFIGNGILCALLVGVLICIIGIKYNEQGSTAVGTAPAPSLSKIDHAPDATYSEQLPESQPVYYTQAELEDVFIDLFAAKDTGSSIETLFKGACSLNGIVYTEYFADRSIVKADGIATLSIRTRKFLFPLVLTWLHWSTAAIGANTLVEVAHESGIDKIFKEDEINRLTRLQTRYNTEVAKWTPYNAPEAEKNCYRRALRKLITVENGKQILFMTLSNVISDFVVSRSKKINIFYARCKKCAQVSEETTNDIITLEEIAEVTRDLKQRIILNQVVCEDKEAGTITRYNCVKDELANWIDKSFDEVLARVEKLNRNPLN